MRPAREVAHEVAGCDQAATLDGDHDGWCDRLTVALEADRREVVEACAKEAGMAAAELLERHNAARRAGATAETLHALSERWAAAGDVAARIRSLLPPPVETADQRLAAAGEFIATWRRWMRDIEADDPDLLFSGALTMDVYDKKTAARLRAVARHLKGELASAAVLDAEPPSPALEKEPR